MIGNIISTFVYEQESPMRNGILITITIDCGNEIWADKSERLKYGELRVNTFVKLASARMVYLYDVMHPLLHAQ